MSVEKQILSTQPQEEEGNKKLTHVYHVITRVYDDLKRVTPITVKDATKYDLVARNADEALLLFSFRERQTKRMEDYSKKLKKIFQKL